MNGTLQHTQPLVAVTYTGRKTDQPMRQTLVALMIDPPDSYSEPVAIHQLSHN